MLLATILTLITGSTDTHVVTVQKEQEEYKVEYITTINGFGALASKEVYGKVHLVETIGEERLCAIHAKDPITAIFAGNAIGYTLSSSTYKKVEGKAEKLALTTNQETATITAKEYALLKEIEEGCNNQKLAEEFGFVRHIYEESFQIRDLLHVDSIPFQVGIKKIGAPFTDGKWGKVLAEKFNVSVMDAGGGRVCLYPPKTEVAPVKTKLSTNTLFSKDGTTYLGMTDEYALAFATFLQEQKIGKEDTVKIAFTGKARNLGNKQFLEDFKEALQKHGFTNLDPELLSVELEGQLESFMLHSLLNSDKPSKLKKFL